MVDKINIRNPNSCVFKIAARNGTMGVPDSHTKCTSILVEGTMPGLPKVSKTERLILEQLVNHPPGKYGLEIVNDSGGAVRRGSVYVLLERLEERGLIKCERNENTPKQGGLPRPIYSATGLGGKVLAAYELLELNLREALS